MTVEIAPVERHRTPTGLSPVASDVYEAALEVEADRFDIPDVKPHLDADYGRNQLFDAFVHLRESGYFVQHERETYNGPETTFEVRTFETLRITIQK